jgi:drug/metabolite transporter (DMT)-like permease
MTVEIVLLIAISVVCDVFGQIAFKMGANRLPAAETVGVAGFCGRMLGEPWLLAGIATYVVEFIVWIRVLALVPLTVAFPIASLNILGITLASHFFLGEVITRKQWMGAVLITGGVAVVAQSV